jgi:hypothetical protein
VPTPLALRKAARILDGEERLRAMLDAPPGAFRRWMAGDEPVPQPVFLMILDFLSDMETLATAGPNSFILSSGRPDEQGRRSG